MSSRYPEALLGHISKESLTYKSKYRNPLRKQVAVKITENAARRYHTFSILCLFYFSLPDLRQHYSIWVVGVYPKKCFSQILFATNNLFYCIAEISFL